MNLLLAEHFVASFVALATTSAKANLHHAKTCTADPDCGDGNYCVIRTGYCEECIDCSKYNRYSGLGECPKSSAACGDCLPGYKRTGLDTFCVFGDNKDKMEILPNITGQNISDRDNGQISYIFYAFGITFILMSIAATVYIYKKNKICRCRDNDDSIDEKVKEMVPIYRTISESDCKSGSYKVGVEEYIKFNHKENRDPSLYAQPFVSRKRYHSEETSEENVYDEVAESLPAEPSAPVVEMDENTADCEWTHHSRTPNQGYIPENGNPSSESRSPRLQQPTSQPGKVRIVENVDSARKIPTSGRTCDAPSVHGSRATADDKIQKPKTPRQVKPQTCSEEYSTRSSNGFPPPDDDSSDGSSALPRIGRLTNNNIFIKFNIK